jgi:hypothetical protein
MTGYRHIDTEESIRSFHTGFVPMKKNAYPSKKGQDFFSMLLHRKSDIAQMPHFLNSEPAKGNSDEGMAGYFDMSELSS